MQDAGLPVLYCYLQQQMCSLCLSHNNLFEKIDIIDSVADRYNIGQIVAVVVSASIVNIISIIFVYWLLFSIN